MPASAGSTFQSSAGDVAGCEVAARAGQAPDRRFNPQPATSPAASYTYKPGVVVRHHRFNPQPATSPAASYTYKPGVESVTIVSILSRRRRRLRAARRTGSRPRRWSCFNPQPAGTSPAASRPSCRSPTTIVKFQSSAGDVAGCEVGTRLVDQSRDRFQSSAGDVAGCEGTPDASLRLVP